MTKPTPDDQTEKPEGKSKQRDRLFEFSPLSASFVFLALLAAFTVIAYKVYNWRATTGPERCLQIERDARNTSNALYDYLENNPRARLPSFEEVAEVYGIQVHRSSNVVIEGSRGNYTVTVYDTHDLCIRGPKYVVYFEGRLAYWHR